MIRTEWVTTATEFHGLRIIRYLGIAYGAASISSTWEVPTYKDARKKALDDMRQNAAQLGANALIAIRYDSSGDGNCAHREIFCYGTAVVVEALPTGGVQ